MSEAMISFPANPCGCGHDRIAHVMMEPPYKCGIPDCPCEAFHHPRFAPMTDATPEIRKLADTIVQRYLAHPDGSFYAELMAQIEPLIASAIAQVLQDERAKRGAVIERLRPTIKQLHMIAATSNEDDGPALSEIADRLSALDPEATQAFDALRERERKLRELAANVSASIEQTRLLTMKSWPQTHSNPPNVEEWRTVIACLVKNGNELEAVLAETEGL